MLVGMVSVRVERVLVGINGFSGSGESASGNDFSVSGKSASGYSCIVAVWMGGTIDAVRVQFSY